MRLRDKYQVIHCLKVYGIDKITNDIAEVELKPIIKQFKNVDLHDVRRPSGEVDVLIGYDYAGWHPTPEQVNEHLIILSNLFGSGRCPSMIENTKKVFS